MIIKEDKQKLMESYAQHEGDTGSPEVQIALLTERIKKLAILEVAFPSKINNDQYINIYKYR